jgi:hypothetical protein
MNPQRKDYCQFLIVTQTNYTQTYFADHHFGMRLAPPVHQASPQGKL